MRWLIPLSVIVSLGLIVFGWWFTEWLSDQRAARFDERHMPEREEDQ